MDSSLIEQLNTTFERNDSLEKPMRINSLNDPDASPPHQIMELSEMVTPAKLTGHPGTLISLESVL